MTAGGPRVRGPAGASGGLPRDRRATARADIEIPAVLRVGTRDVACTIRNLSTQGIALAVTESVAPGMVVRVVFRLPNARQPIEVSGILVRIDGGRLLGTVGLQFIEPGADSVRDISTFVTRNRSDLPFSGRPAGARKSGRPDKSESGASLGGLYKRAVKEVAEKRAKRGGLFARWRDRLKS